MPSENYDYSKKDIVRALLEIGITKGDNIFTHSNIGFFGRLEGAKSQEDYYRIFKEAIFEVIGSRKDGSGDRGSAGGTLVLPTFSYSFCKKQPYDKKSTPSVCGLFSEMVRKDQEAIRSDDANFSIAAIGKNAELFTRNAPEHSFGPDSFWDRFLHAGGKICNFNFDAGSTLIHYVEKKITVPYRYDKGFPGKAIEGGKETDKIFYHYVYDLAKQNNEADFTKFDKKAKELGLAKVVKLGK